MRCIINLSNKKYLAGQDRLLQTLEIVKTPNVDNVMFKSEKDVNSPLHSDNMYAFKPFAFKKAIDMGYRVILWLDASMYVLKDLTPIFDKIEKDGYYFQKSGWLNSEWTNQMTKDVYGDEGEMISSGVLGLNMETDIAKEFLHRWFMSAKEGYFNGSHEDHRHDQSLASLIAHKLEMKITKNNTDWQYGNPNELTLHDNILIIANGII